MQNWIFKEKSCVLTDRMYWFIQMASSPVNGVTPMNGWDTKGKVSELMQDFSGHCSHGLQPTEDKSAAWLSVASPEDLKESILSSKKKKTKPCVRVLQFNSFNCIFLFSS